MTTGKAGNEKRWEDGYGGGVWSTHSTYLYRNLYRKRRGDEEEEKREGETSPDHLPVQSWHPSLEAQREVAPWKNCHELTVFCLNRETRT